MDSAHPIAVVSFGCEREIWWRKIGEKGVVPPENRQLLRHGSLFVMPAGFQDLYEHRIPKSPGTTHTRISLTFRRYI
jgi:alkylated DNA repair dioxygenase AlkB